MKATYDVPVLDTLPLWSQGKSRDTFEIPGHDDKLLVVATPRISTHNIVHRSRIPCKDEVLTALMIHWCSEVLPRAGIRTHLLACGQAIYDYLPEDSSEYPGDLHRKAIIVRKLAIIPFEFVFRNYMAGSVYRDFHAKGLPNPYGVDFKPDLPLMYEFARATFTPTEKSDTDEPVNAKRIMDTYPQEVELAEKSLNTIRHYMNERGIELVDSKCELGRDAKGVLFIADEIATPDSSRLCELTAIREGHEPPWLDKQLARDEAERLWAGAKREPLVFSKDIEKHLSNTYLKLFERLVGTSLRAFQQKYLE